MAKQRLSRPGYKPTLSLDYNGESASDYKNDGPPSARNSRPPSASRIADKPAERPSSASSCAPAPPSRPRTGPGQARRKLAPVSLPRLSRNSSIEDRPRLSRKSSIEDRRASEPFTPKTPKTPSRRSSAPPVPHFKHHQRTLKRFDVDDDEMQDARGKGASGNKPHKKHARRTSFDVAAGMLGLSNVDVALSRVIYSKARSKLGPMKGMETLLAVSQDAEVHKNLNAQLKEKPTAQMKPGVVMKIVSRVVLNSAKEALHEMKTKAQADEQTKESSEDETYKRIVAELEAICRGDDLESDVMEEDSAHDLRTIFKDLRLLGIQNQESFRKNVVEVVSGLQDTESLLQKLKQNLESQLSGLLEVSGDLSRVALKRVERIKESVERVRSQLGTAAKDVVKREGLQNQVVYGENAVPRQVSGLDDISLPGANGMPSSRGGANLEQDKTGGVKVGKLRGSAWGVLAMLQLYEETFCNKPVERICVKVNDIAVLMSQLDEIPPELVALIALVNESTWKRQTTDMSEIEELKDFEPVEVTDDDGGTTIGRDQLAISSAADHRLSISSDKDHRLSISSDKDQRFSMSSDKDQRLSMSSDKEQRLPIPGEQKRRRGSNAGDDEQGSDGESVASRASRASTVQMAAVSAGWRRVVAVDDDVPPILGNAQDSDGEESSGSLDDERQPVVLPLMHSRSRSASPNPGLRLAPSGSSRGLVTLTDDTPTTQKLPSDTPPAPKLPSLPTSPSHPKTPGSRGRPFSARSDTSWGFQLEGDADVGGAKVDQQSKDQRKPRLSILTSQAPLSSPKRPSRPTVIRTDTRK